MCGISCLLTFCTEDEDNAVEKLKDSAGYEVDFFANIKIPLK